jgi:hypothetical protein
MKNKLNSENVMEETQYNKCVCVYIYIYIYMIFCS